ncbi:MAG TPA: hypothetical protein VIH35_08505 [Kiritimatiellia bacterium]
MALLAALSLTATAQDAIVLTSGQTVKGHVLRYDNSRFSVFVSNSVREFYADDVHSVFFGVDGTELSAEQSAAETSAPPAIVETVVSVKPASNAVAASASTGAPPGSAAAKQVQARTEYGPSEGNFTVSEMLAKGAQLYGKVIKLEFFSRGVIREGADRGYFTALTDGQASVDVAFGKESYSWFSQLPDRITYTDVSSRSARAYYLYGISGKSDQQVYLGGRAVQGCTFQPIGRKTKKGIKGVEYAW